MYIEIRNEFEDQKVLYFKLNNAFNMNRNYAENTKLKGVYAIYGNGTWLYVGQSTNIASRLATHLRGKYKNASNIFFFNIENIGFDNFEQRPKDNQAEILDNCERWLMSKLKPVDNININMDFELSDDKAPSINFESTPCYTIKIDEGFITIVDNDDIDWLTALDYYISHYKHHNSDINLVYHKLSIDVFGSLYENNQKIDKGSKNV